MAATVAIALAIGGCAELTRQRDAEAERAAALAGQPVGAVEPGETISDEVETFPLALEGEPAAPPETQRVGGSGDFVTAPTTVMGTGSGQEGDITLNFVNADVREVVRSVLGDMLGENYVLDPRVQGSITVQTSRPLPRGALLPMLEEILALNGFALVRKPDNFVVLPLQEAISSAGVSGSFLPGGGVTRGFAVRILSFEHVGAAEMAQILEPVVPAGGVLRVDAARNLMIVAGTQQELQALHELATIFDVDWMSGMSFALVPLDYADPEAIIGELQSIFGDAGSGPLAGLLRFVPVDRINAVLVIATRPHYIDQAEEWIARLDQGETENQAQRLFVYYVRNGRADDLASVLQDAFAPSEDEVPRAALAPGTERAEIGSEAPRRAGLQDEAGAAAGEEAPLSEPVATAGAVARAAGSGGEGIGLGGTSDIRIIPDEANNALLVLATARQYRMVESALRKLDIVPLQVLIEATIAEVTLTDTLRYGVEWFLQSGNSSATLSTLATGVASQTFPGFSYLLSAGTDARVVLNALENITDVNVISSPQLMVLDNQTAELQVGQDVPVATQQQQSSASGDAPLVNSIEFREVGIILRVTPRVNPGGLVIMEVEQEVSSVVGGAGTVIPTFQQRRVQSSIAVQSGETVALGGLIQDDRNRVKTGVPFLQDVPLLGELFSTTSDVDTRTELLVVITPRVVGNQEEARAVTEELRAKMRAVIPLSPQIQDRTIKLAPLDGGAP